MAGVKKWGVAEVRGQWLVENLQASHGHPHVSGERLVHGGVVKRQKYGHVWLQGGRGRGKSHPQRHSQAKLSLQQEAWKHERL